MKGNGIYTVCLVGGEEECVYLRVKVVNRLPLPNLEVFLIQADSSSLLSLSLLMISNFASLRNEADLTCNIDKLHFSSLARMRTSLLQWG